MSILLDPFYFYLLLLIGLIGGGVAVGVVAAELLPLLSAFILLWLVGLVFGQYTVSTETETIGSVAVSVLVAGVAAYFLPFDRRLVIGVFLFGYLYGVMLRRHTR